MENSKEVTEIASALETLTMLDRFFFFIKKQCWTNLIFFSFIYMYMDTRRWKNTLTNNMENWIEVYHDELPLATIWIIFSTTNFANNIVSNKKTTQIKPSFHKIIWNFLNFLVPNSKNTFSDSKSRTFENVINNHRIYFHYYWMLNIFF